MSEPNRNFPPELNASFQPVWSEAMAAFYQERYADAIVALNHALQLLVEAQTNLGRGVHKGAVLYQLGVASLGTDNPREALRNILLAYVEDTLGTPIDFEDDADRTPAGRALFDGFVIQLRLLREIKCVSRGIKETVVSWQHAMDPLPILEKALSQVGSTLSNALLLCQRQNLTIGPAPLGFPQPRDRRVFLGTNYDTHPHVIPEMRLATLNRNYVPVAARDVVVPPNANVHDVSLLLLHTCTRAIFDVTQPAGQFMEIERARDYGVNVLLVRTDPVSHPPHVSQMICSLGYPLQAYRDMAELRQRVANFLTP